MTKSQLIAMLAEVPDYAPIMLVSDEDGTLAEATHATLYGTPEFSGEEGVEFVVIEIR